MWQSAVGWGGWGVGVLGVVGAVGEDGVGEETTTRTMVVTGTSMTSKATITTMTPCVVASKSVPRDTTSAQRVAHACLLVPHLHLHAHSQHPPALFTRSSTWIRVPANVLSMFYSSPGYLPFLKYPIKRLGVLVKGVVVQSVPVNAEAQVVAGQAEMLKMNYRKSLRSLWGGYSYTVCKCSIILNIYFTASAVKFAVHYFNLERLKIEKSAAGEEVDPVVTAGELEAAVAVVAPLEQSVFSYLLDQGFPAGVLPSR